MSRKIWQATETPFPADLPRLGDPRRTQAWELPTHQPVITEYRQHLVCCPHCQTVTQADLLPAAPPGAFGVRATAMLALLRSRYHLSLDDTVEFFAEVWNFPLSAASIVTSCERVSDALAPIDAAIQAVVQTSDVVHADESPWPTETRKGWLWVAVGRMATCFRIHPSRRGSVLRHLLGDA